MDTLERLAEEAIGIIQNVEHAIGAIEANRKALAALLTTASDVAPTLDQADGKVAMLLTWRASIAQLDAAIAVLRAVSK